MRFRTIAIAAALAAGLGTNGEAFAPHKGAEGSIVASGRPARLHRTTAFTSPKLPGLTNWRAIMDRDTDVPLRLWGPSLATPGASADPKVAEVAARAFLARYLDVLAPGASPSDFVLSANQLDPSGSVRTVAFVQRATGLEVVGGSIGLAFERDHLIMASSTALPHVNPKLPGGAQSAPAIANAAIAWLAQSNHQVVLRAHGARVILPIVRPRGNAGPEIEYRVAETVSVESTREAGRWDVWIDALDGTPIARRSTLAFASGVVQFNVPDRYPLSTRSGHPAPYATHTINGATVTAALDGSVTWTGASPATVAPGLAGTFVAITNVAGTLIADTLTLADGGIALWDKSADEPSDAQLDAYVYANTAKQFVRTRLNPSLAWLAGQVSVSVNEQMTCNAFSTGDDIHFFKKDTQCENTGRIADVVYHESGHSVHYNSIIPGQGQFDSSLSEGLADTLGVSITGDHGLGRGFFFTDAPLRDLDPVGVEKKWPQDADGEPHDEGEIIGETLWDLRTALQAKLGDGPGLDRELKIYYGIMQRAADIPSTYAEALVADDDDGNLANGTPNQCEINRAFGIHGLADPSASIGLTPPTRDNFNVSFTISPPAGSSCTPPTVTSAVVDWTPRGGTGGELTFADAANTWTAAIPTQPDGTVVQYSVKITLSDGSTLTYPDNPADPQYQFYVGTVTPIKCFDFEGGIGDWTHGGSPAANDEWAAGPILGIGGDPKAAHGGSNVLGIDLGTDDGLYSAMTKQWAESPEIDLQGYTNVRLQYWRWLGVEDGAYDQATIFANDASVWTNLASPGMPTAEVNHLDKEWRFQDVDLSAQAATGKLKLKFELDSDPGLQLAGWTIDDVCVVAVGAAGPVCGDGVVTGAEQCDDGNTTSGDGCSSTCQDEHKAGGGCCSAGTNPAGPIALSVVTIGLVLVRRRRKVA